MDKVCRKGVKIKKKFPTYNSRLDNYNDSKSGRTIQMEEICKRKRLDIEYNRRTTNFLYNSYAAVLSLMAVYAKSEK